MDFSIDNPIKKVNSEQLQFEEKARKAARRRRCLCAIALIVIITIAGAIVGLFLGNVIKIGGSDSPSPPVSAAQSSDLNPGTAAMHSYLVPSTCPNPCILTLAFFADDEDSVLVEVIVGRQGMVSKWEAEYNGGNLEITLRSDDPNFEFGEHCTPTVIASGLCFVAFNVTNDGPDIVALNSTVVMYFGGTPTPTPLSASASKTSTPTPAQTSTSTGTQTSTPSNTPSGTGTATLSVGASPSSTPSNTPTISLSSSVSPSDTSTPSSSKSEGASVSASMSRPPSASRTPTPSTTNTRTSSKTPTSTKTGTSSASNSRTATDTPPVTPSATSSPVIGPVQGSFYTIPSGLSSGLSEIVKTMHVFDDALYIGGEFSLLADLYTSAKGIVKYTSANGFEVLPAGSSNGVVGNVYALMSFQNKLYIGGNFQTLGDGTTSAKRIVSWDGSAWSPLPCGSFDGVNAPVLSLAVFQDTLYLGGEFGFLSDGTNAKYIARWDGSTWSNVLNNGATTNGVGNFVRSLYVYNGLLYVGGSFDSLFDGTSAKYIATYNGSAWGVLPTGATNGLGNYVYAMTEFEGELYIGGAFRTLGDTSKSASYIITWNTTHFNRLPSGTCCNGLASWSGGGVTALLVYDELLFIGGMFYKLGDGVTQANSIVAWNGNTWVDVPAGSSKNGVAPVQYPHVWSMAAFEDHLFIGGEFVAYTVNLGETLHLTKRDSIAPSTWWLPVQGPTAYGVSGTVSCMLGFGNALFIGGGFETLASGERVNYIVAYNGDDGSWTALTSGADGAVGVDGPVHVLYEWQGELYIGGEFTHLGDDETSANRIVRFSQRGEWNVLPSGNSNGVAGAVYAMIEFQSKLVIAGGFSSMMDLTTVGRMVYWDGGTMSRTTSASNNGAQTGIIAALAVFDNYLYVGGSFTSAGGVTVKNLARFDGSAWSAVPAGASNGVSDAVHALRVWNGDLYVGGEFLSLGNLDVVKRVVKWTGTAWQALPVANSAEVGVADYVYNFGVYGDELYIVGEFTALGGLSVSAKRVTRWNGTDFNSLPVGNSNGLGGDAWALAVYQGRLYIGGSFANLGDATPAGSVVAWASVQ